MAERILIVPDTHWRMIPDYPGYEVTESGEVRSWLKSGPGSAGNYREEPIVKTAKPDKDGYLRVSIKVAPGKYRRIGVHRLVAKAFLPDTRFEGGLVLHNDGNPANNHVSNLRWGTQAENMADRGIHGTFTNAHSPETIKEIRRLYKMGFEQREIARVFKTSQSYIHDVVNYKRRKDVK